MRTQVGHGLRPCRHCLGQRWRPNWVTSFAGMVVDFGSLVTAPGRVKREETRGDAGPAGPRGVRPRNP